MFTACGNRAGGKRISRCGVRQVVDFYLKKTDLKLPGVSGYALRHTGATRGYQVLAFQEVADTLRLRAQTIYEYTRMGKLPAASFGNRYRITEQDIKKFIEYQKSITRRDCNELES